MRKNRFKPTRAHHWVSYLYVWEKSANCNEDFTSLASSNLLRTSGHALIKCESSFCTWTFYLFLLSIYLPFDEFEFGHLSIYLLIVLNYVFIFVYLYVLKCWKFEDKLNKSRIVGRQKEKLKIDLYSFMKGNIITRCIGSTINTITWLIEKITAGGKCKYH